MITIPKIIRPLKLADYAPEYEGQELGIHVNPGASWFERYSTAARAGDEETVLLALSEVLYEDGQPMQPETLRAVFVQASDVDPALVTWIHITVLNTITEFRRGVKKV